MAIKFAYGYVSDINVSFQWGGQGGSVQMTIIEDPDDSVFYQNPGLGTPVGVSCGDLYVGGILKRSTYSESVSAGRKFDVVVESPSEFLDGIQVILGDWNQANIDTGSIFNAYTNVLNAFAYYENNNGFGSAGVNSSGMDAYAALSAVSTIATSPGLYGFAPRFGSYSYYLDLSELLSITPRGYRLSGPVQSLNSIVQDICEATGHDYSINLTGFSGPNSIITNPTIRVITLDKSQPPSTGAVGAYVNSNFNAVVSRENGAEYAVPTTHKVVIGGPVQRFLYVDGLNAMPVFGKLSNGNWIWDYQTTANNAYFNTTGYNVPIEISEGGGLNYLASMWEVRMALSGRDTWETWKALESGLGFEINRNVYSDLPAPPWVSRLETTAEFIHFAQTGQATSIDFMPTSSKYVEARIDDRLADRCSKIFAAVSRVATEYYGQVFMYPLGGYYSGSQSDNVKFIQDDVVVEQSWDNVDAAFTSSKPFPDPSFYDGQGRLKGGAAFQTPTNQAGWFNVDYSALGGDWCRTPDGGIATWKGGADKEIYWFNGYPYCIVRSGGQCRQIDGYTTTDYGFGVMWAVATGDTSLLVNPVYLTASGQNLHLSIAPAPLIPRSYGIPQESNKYKHGPWGVGGNGKAEVIFDDSFVPENFGSFANLNIVAAATAAQGNAAPASNETGTITFLGLPNFNIGARFNGSGPYITGMSVQENSGGSTVTYQLSNWTPQQGKLARFNIDRIKKINKGIIADVQKRRSLVKKQAFPKMKFEKSNIDELRAAHSNPASNFALSFINEVTQ